MAKKTETKIEKIESKYKIYFNLEEDMAFQLASLQLILNQDKIEKDKVEYIDLRFDKPVISYER